jgi:hypothetical protein
MRPLSDSDLQDIQGVALGRFRKDQQDLIFLRFGPAAGAQRLLAKLAPRIANAWEVQRFNQFFSEIKARTSNEGTIESTWIALGISANGYTKLGVALQELGTSEGANAFRSGMAARSAQQIGDPATDGPATWLDAFKPGAGVDAVLIIASDNRDDLDRTTDEFTSQIQDSGSEIVYRERGATLPAP